jgi:hypothetical protein
MKDYFQLPSLNALQSSDRDILRMAFRMLVSEINDLREQLEKLRTESIRGKGY